jgi:hypothetical protein
VNLPRERWPGKLVGRTHGLDHLNEQPGTDRAFAVASEIHFHTIRRHGQGAARSRPDGVNHDVSFLVQLDFRQHRDSGEPVVVEQDERDGILDRDKVHDAVIEDRDIH